MAGEQLGPRGRSEARTHSWRACAPSPTGTEAVEGGDVPRPRSSSRRRRRPRAPPGGRSRDRPRWPSRARTTPAAAGVGSRVAGRNPPSRATRTRGSRGRRRGRAASTRSRLRLRPDATVHALSRADSGTTFGPVPAAPHGRGDGGARAGTGQGGREEREVSELQQGGGAACRDRGRVGGASRERHREGARTLPRDLGRARERGLEHEDLAVRARPPRDSRVREARLPKLFVGREQKRDPRGFRARARSASTAIATRDARLHVEDSRPAHPPVLDAKGNRRERPLGPDGVVVAEQERAIGALSQSLANYRIGRAGDTAASRPGRGAARNRSTMSWARAVTADASSGRALAPDQRSEVGQDPVRGEAAHRRHPREMEGAGRSTDSVRPSRKATSDVEAEAGRSGGRPPSRPPPPPPGHDDVALEVAPAGRDVSGQGEAGKAARATLCARPIPDSSIPPHQRGTPASTQRSWMPAPR
jgi:hypothetical protein